MKYLRTLTLTAVGVVAITGLSSAQVVTSIQFTRGQYGQGTPLAPAQAAGIPSETVANWNSETTYGSGQGNVQHDWSDGAYLTEANTIGLVTSSGAPSPISYSVSSYGNISDGTGFASGTNNAFLENGAAATATGTLSTGSTYNPVSLTLNGLKASDSYEFVVYLNGGPSVAEEASVGLNGGATEYFLTPNGGYDLSPLSTFVAASQTSDFSAGSGSFIGNLPNTPQSYSANYATFADTGVTSATLTLTALGSYGGNDGLFVESAADSAFPVGIAGVSVIDLSETPEPSTWAMVFGGLGMLAFVVRRKANLLK